MNLYWTNVPAKTYPIPCCECEKVMTLVDIEIDLEDEDYWYDVYQCENPVCPQYNERTPDNKHPRWYDSESGNYYEVIDLDAVPDNQLSLF